MEDNAKRRYTLRKDEKLRHKRLVDELFNEGESLYDFPLRLVWRRVSPEALEASFKTEVPPRLGELQMLITVPKKKRRHAVDRVLMRRRIREAYRLSRLPLKERLEADMSVGTLSLAFIYLCDKNLPYSLIEEKMSRLLSKLAKRVFPSSGSSVANH